MRSSLSALALAVVACGGSVSPGTTSDAGTSDASPSPPSPLLPPCPASAPAEGSTCTPVAGPCEYGGVGPFRQCSTIFDCSSSTLHGPFQWHGAPGVCPDPSTNSADCPATFGAVPNGSACPTRASCTYAEGVCGCHSCVPDGGGAMSTEWKCAAYPTSLGPNCPVPRPPLGSACSQEGEQCLYGSNCCTVSAPLAPTMGCRQGVWGSGALGFCSCAISVCGR